MSKIRLATVWLDGCSGCHMSFLDIDERLITLAEKADLVYSPLVTPLVAAARERGVGAVNGVGMLIHQAALAFRLWTGEDPPMEAMSAGALTALGSSH